MEVAERTDFIQIDFKDGQFITVCITGSRSLPGVEREHVDFGIMQRFGNALEDCIKFTLGAMSAIRLFKEGVYRPSDIIEIVFTKEAKERILKRKYRGAEILFPDLRTMKNIWKGVIK